MHGSLTVTEPGFAPQRRTKLRCGVLSAPTGIRVRYSAAEAPLALMKAR